MKNSPNHPEPVISHPLASFRLSVPLIDSSLSLDVNDLFNVVVVDHFEGYLREYTVLEGDFSQRY